MSHNQEHRPASPDHDRAPGRLSRRTVFRLAGGATAGAVLLDGGSALVAAEPASATTVVPQAGPVPVVIDQSATIDDLTVLLGTAAAHPSDMVIQNPGEGRKNFWIYNFGSSDYLSWQVSVASGDVYRAYALVQSQTNQQLTITVAGTSSTSTGATDANQASAWQKVDLGSVTLPAGSSTLTLTRTGTLYGDINVKSVEVVRQSDIPARQSRIAAARADTSWFAQAKYGVMLQYGSWGFPNNVGTAKSLAQQAADFNVPQLVKMLQETGASYLIWSISWFGYHADAPISSIDGIVTAAGGPASPGLTSSRDLIGEVIAACKAVGIKFMMYYHTGDEDSAWWPYQNFPTSFSANGSGDRSTFFANWQRVVTEIGNRYGTDLYGWFFDDAHIYYPAPFEQLQAAARAGNPGRLISWNGTELQQLSFTDFQDVWFGCYGHAEPTWGSAGVGGNGVFTSGPDAGQLQNNMFTMDNDWGIHQQGEKIGAQFSSASVIGWVTSAASRNVPMAADLMMYEDGTVSDQDLRVLNDLRQAVYGTPPAYVPTGTTMVNDTDAGITYAGTWQYSAGRSFGDYNGDVHYTTTNGDSFSYTFNGTGIDVISEKYSDEGLIDVYVDGTYVLTANAASGSRQAQQVVYSARHLSPGNHTVKCVKKSGSYMLLDALRVIPNPTTVNDTDPSIAYTGTWTYSAHRSGGDYNDDVHWTQTVGDSATISFTGTGIDYLGPLEPGGATANLILDGVQVGTTKAYFAGAYTAQQFLYQVRGLTPGQHTLRLVMTGGAYLQIDAFQIWP